MADSRKGKHESSAVSDQRQKIAGNSGSSCMITSADSPTFPVPAPVLAPAPVPTSTTSFTPIHTSAGISAMDWDFDSDEELRQVEEEKAKKRAEAIQNKQAQPYRSALRLVNDLPVINSVQELKDLLKARHIVLAYEEYKACWLDHQRELCNGTEVSIGKLLVRTSTILETIMWREGRGLFELTELFPEKDDWDGTDHAAHAVVLISRFIRSHRDSPFYIKMITPEQAIEIGSKLLQRLVYLDATSRQKAKAHPRVSQGLVVKKMVITINNGVDSTPLAESTENVPEGTRAEENAVMENPLDLDDD